MREDGFLKMYFSCVSIIVRFRSRHRQWPEHGPHIWARLVRLLGLWFEKVERSPVPEGLEESEFVNEFVGEGGGEDWGCVG